MRRVVRVDRIVALVDLLALRVVDLDRRAARGEPFSKPNIDLRRTAAKRGSLARLAPDELG